jgi:hypothetical protein
MQIRQTNSSSPFPYPRWGSLTLPSLILKPSDDLAPLPCLESPSSAAGSTLITDSASDQPRWHNSVHYHDQVSPLLYQHRCSVRVDLSEIRAVIHCSPLTFLSLEQHPSPIWCRSLAGLCFLPHPSTSLPLSLSFHDAFFIPHTFSYNSCSPQLSKPAGLRPLVSLTCSGGERQQWERSPALPGPPSRLPLFPLPASHPRAARNILFPSIGRHRENTTYLALMWTALFWVPDIFPGTTNLWPFPYLVYFEFSLCLFTFYFRLIFMVPHRFFLIFLS